MKAILNNYRQAPRKVRLVADLIRGKKVDKAELLLKHSLKDAGFYILKLLNSAVSNATNKGIEKSNLKIEKITVDGGYILKRMRPRARGSAFVIRKRTSKVVLNLSDDSLANDKSIDESKVEKKSKKSVVDNKKSLTLNKNK